MVFFNAKAIGKIRGLIYVHMLVLYLPPALQGINEYAIALIS
jgi:hypothetical protein